MKKIKKKKRGFTLVEMMVSVAIFTIIITTGVGLLVSVLKKYEFAQDQKKAVDSLNFVVESMVRDIRLGTDYHISDDNISPGSVPANGISVGNGSGDLIGFTSSDDRGYFIYSMSDDGVLQRKIYEPDVNGEYSSYNLAIENMTDKESVAIKKIRFTGMNSNSIENPDGKQPLVWIQILASTKKSKKDYLIQTLVSQRSLES